MIDIIFISKKCSTLESRSGRGVMMQNLPGYNNSEKIYENDKSIIFRAVKDKDNWPVVLKLLNNQYPSREETQIFNREFDMISCLSDDGIIKPYERSEIDGLPVIIMEDVGAESLDKVLKSRKLVITEFLNLAIRITEILGTIHKHNIIHKDLNPSNIIWNIDKDIVKIIDFGISTKLSREITSVKNPNVLEGNISYISPEQTGRMNRAMDYRTDYYSLGVTFFWMLTKRLPFESDDMLELVHSHIAVLPPLLHEVDKNIPEALSDIVMKLMAKNEEDRYLSAHGLKADLEHCLEEFKKTGKIKPFELGTSDISDKFQIPQKLYGREKETELLISVFERVRENQTELMLVSGSSGIGKSLLINELHKPILKYSGYFISGKFERLKKDVPYSAIIQAFTNLARQILAGEEAKIKVWKKKILLALGPNGKIITDIFPFFKHIIGEQPEVHDLNPVETQNRFNLVFKNFVSVLSSQEHPLVLFLDDLQWADSASLHVLKLFTTESDIKHLYVIGSYRNNETPESHPLIITLEEIEESETTMNSILLEPLTKEHVSQLLSDTLNRKAGETAPLSELVIQKTRGNPFFINEFLKFLYKESLIEFSFEKGWFWDIEAIEGIQATDNVIELMSGQIEDLPVESQEILKLCSCIGSVFEVPALAVLSGEAETDVIKSLDMPLREGMLNRIDDVYGFSHDRILESAYSLIPGEEKIQMHYRIGSLELKNATLEELGEKAFYIANQLNAGSSLIKEGPEKQKLAELNLMAGTKALASNAYDSACNYLYNGIENLEKESWKRNYAFTLDLYRKATAAASLSADYDTMEKLAEVVFQNAREVLDKIRVYEAKIFAFAAQNHPRKSIRIGLLALKELGFDIPEKPSTQRVAFELVCTKLSLIGKPIEDFINLPETKDQRIVAACQMISAIGLSTGLTNPNLLSVVIFTAIRLFGKYGTSIFAPTACAAYGLAHCGIIGDIEAGYRWGELAIGIINKYDIRKSKSWVWLLMFYMIQHLKKPLRTTLNPLLDGYRFGLENGDLEMAATSANCYTGNMFLAGIGLEEVEKQISIYAEIIRKLNQHTIINFQNLQHQTVLNLMSESDNPCELSGRAYGVEKMLPHEEKNDNMVSFVFSAYSLNLCYIYENIEEAFNHAEICHQLADKQVTLSIVPVVCFYDSLTRLASWPDAKKSKQKRLMKQVRKNQKKMMKWAFHSPSNYSHKFHLVEAEIARIQKEAHKAVKHYDTAVKLAHENEFLNEEALCLELFAKFWMEQNVEDIAEHYMTKAYSTYRLWGAMGKVKQLEMKYAHLIELKSSGKSSRTESEKFCSGTKKTTSDSIDMSTVIKTSQALMSEIELDNLLKNIVRFSIENAGAQRGFLILENDEDKSLYIEVGNEIGSETKILESIPVNNNIAVSSTIVNYVNRTGENVVLNNAHKEGSFIDDPYIASKKVKSLVCFPIVHKGKVSGIMYLENNITINAFTPERLNVLKILSSQAAISIENARLLIHRESTAKLEREMEIAAKIQTGLLPKNPKIEDYEISAYMKPADDVGGDYYDVINVAGRDWIVIGDVSGHGVPAGLVMIMAQTAIHVILNHHPELPPSELLTLVNGTIEENIRLMGEEKYITITVFACHENGKLFFSGLHQDIMIFRAGKNDVELVQSNGMWIGMFADIQHMLTDDILELGLKDTMLLYTDGITEAWAKGSVRNERETARDMFGDARLKNIFMRLGNRPLDEIRDGILHELERYVTDDDVTMVLVRRLK